MRPLVGRRIVATAALALGLASCGGGGDADTGDDASPSEEPASSAEESSADDTEPSASSSDAAEDPGEATSGEEPGGSSEEARQLLEDVLLAADRDVTARSRVVSTAQTPDGEVTIRAEGVQAGTDSRMTMSFDGAGPAAAGGGPAQAFEAEVILLDGVMYQRSEVFTQQLGPDVEWVKFDLDAMGGQFSDVLEAQRSADPQEALDVFRDAAEVRIVGQEEIEGVATTHMVVSIRFGDALEANGLGPDAAGTSGVDPDELVDYDLWVDDDHRMRRMRVEMDVEGASTSTTIDVLEYDIDVEITPPPDDVTVDLADITGGSGQG